MEETDTLKELIITMLPALIILALGIIYLIIYFAIDSIRTTYYLRKNQKAWNKYAKGLNYQQRLNIFPEWLDEQRRINGTDYYYIPRMMGKNNETD